MGSPVIEDGRAFHNEYGQQNRAEISPTAKLFDSQRGLPEPSLKESERALLQRQAEVCEEQRFTAILDELKAEFPECARLALRELKILAGARMRVPFESRAANGGSVRGWVEAYRVFREQLTKVIAINKGYKPAEDVERDRIFADYARTYRHKYPAAMKLDEKAVRTFARRSTTLAIIIGNGVPGHDECYDRALRLYEESKMVVESLERGLVPNYQRVNKSFAELYGGSYARAGHKGHHLCPNSCPGGCNVCCVTIVGKNCPGCYHCNADHHGMPTYDVSLDCIRPRDLEDMRRRINVLAGADRNCDFNIAVVNRNKYVEYCRARDQGLVVNICELTDGGYQTIRTAHPEWLGFPRLTPQFINRPIDSNFVKQNMEGVRNAQVWARRQRDEAMRIGTIAHEIHDEISVTVDFSKMEEKMAHFYNTQLGEPFVTEQAAKEYLLNKSPSSIRIQYSMADAAIRVDRYQDGISTLLYAIPDCAPDADGGRALLAILQKAKYGDVVFDMLEYEDNAETIRKLEQYFVPRGWPRTTAEQRALEALHRGEPFYVENLPAKDSVVMDEILKMANAKVEPTEPVRAEGKSPLIHRRGTPINELNKINKEPGAIIPCPDCLNTPGKYVGFTVTENCRRCDGSAKIANPDYVPAMLNPCSTIPAPARPSARFPGGAKY